MAVVSAGSGWVSRFLPFISSLCLSCAGQVWPLAPDSLGSISLPAPCPLQPPLPHTEADGTRQLVDSRVRKARGIGFLGLMPESRYTTDPERAKDLVGTSFQKST